MLFRSKRSTPSSALDSSTLRAIMNIESKSGACQPERTARSTAASPPNFSSKAIDQTPRTSPTAQRDSCISKSPTTCWLHTDGVLQPTQLRHTSVRSPVIQLCMGIPIVCNLTLEQTRLLARFRKHGLRGTLRLTRTTELTTRHHGPKASRSCTCPNGRGDGLTTR